MATSTGAAPHRECGRPVGKRRLRSEKGHHLPAAADVAIGDQPEDLVSLQGSKQLPQRRRAGWQEARTIRLALIVEKLEQLGRLHGLDDPDDTVAA